MAGLKRITELLRYRNDMERLVRYAERYYAKNRDWPTVRRAAQSLKLKQSDVVQLTDDGDELCLDSYFVNPPLPVAESFVYSMRGQVARKDG